MAGFSTEAAVEVDQAARSTLLRNAERWFPSLTEHRLFGDIARLDSDEVLDAVGSRPGEIDLVHGGPPCTPFSKSGYWLEYKRRGADPKASLLDDYVDVLDAVKPKSFLMENVYGLAYRNQNRAVFDRFLSGVEAAGFIVDHRVLLAADFGVPQLRQRLVCVGIRKDLLDTDLARWEFPWPEPTHSGPHETRKGWDLRLPPHVTVSEAFQGLSAEANQPEPEELVRGRYAEELEGVPPGENYLFWTAERGHPAPRFRWRSRYWSFLLKLNPNRPAPTIQGQPGPWVGPFHWENRRLRVAELKRLMGFPDSFEVLGTRREQQLQLGNAVPPRLAELVAQRVADELRRVGVAARPATAAA
jgi:DNA (cytosine-5)-methyltransferase 1